MDRSELDKLIMLLSTDWFMPHWRVIGIHLAERPKVCVQQGCRDIVRRIMSERAEYYHVEFSAARVDATWSTFDNLLKECEAEREIIVDSLLADKSDTLLDDGTEWLITVLTERLLNDRATNEPELDSEVLALLGGLRSVLAGRRGIDFSKLCLGSDSEWDKYTRSVTPEIPSMLGHEVSAILTRNDFGAIWNFINSRLTDAQKRKLLDWY